MTYRSTKQGGLVTLHAIQCATCGTQSPTEPHVEFAWARARALGWEVPPASYRGPYCPDCIPMFGTLNPKAAA